MLSLKKKKKTTKNRGIWCLFFFYCHNRISTEQTKKMFKKTSCQMIPEAYTWSKTYSRNGCDVCARTIKRVHIDNKKPEAPREGGAAH